MTTQTGHTQAIAASRVIGTSVYNTEGTSIGSIEDVMLDKMTNGIMFAVIGFGGFLGIGEKYHAIPWASLDYDEDKGGYVVPFSKEQLRAAPAYSINELSGADGEVARDESYNYYKVTPYWH
ncbi:MULTISPECIES: PRC-barrel domain-containing protein [unclassified Mesorhizobium]|jgi:sporulation protein YlmC with PRC-barrel domain|uniref:PRC-barrel domain-containing protein n=1 Tax=unclassified Mesorhizobium TaxID=325217 RepID=UPI000FCBFC3A|nr:MULTISPECIES: PRC-barrel domain-containing protein [unclassified Mesorhizobium]AZV21802.1 PRC-barrel domain containing protein [Mesorhizobium sp. M7A.F.Ce.TU.012.03.2.1]RUU72809.1 PRC-barrel domain containing protein [Mesorhizobium sp. M7A.F.Ca.MR.362.00.0.0]RUU84142.1 PRC-barrel domain containing protein [Mesorhizobium sp. M7A.F.Ca.MR.176.00.0.0]RVD04754.1 PRC-barrel domain containing protein [Mesorhizobium sp. M7A.F.Ca.ET.027.02.1.1]RVD62625.1 PRC-barrel domain containing protein [Mesorhi